MTDASDASDAAGATWTADPAPLHDEILAIFPTPIMLARGAIPEDLVARLITQFEAAQGDEVGANVRTALLTHTPMASPASHDNFREVLRHVGPRIQAYGETLLGERLNWGVKEIWINRLETGGTQKMHNHANSFVSGIVYLTESHPSAATVFYRNSGVNTFQMANENERCRITVFNSPIYRVPDVAPGDIVLFPSYLLHEVPPNQGPPRLTAAFNALPERLDNWGYTVRFR